VGRRLPADPLLAVPEDLQSFESSEWRRHRQECLRHNGRAERVDDVVAQALLRAGPLPGNRGPDRTRSNPV
jgi:hypothetical protein